MEDRETARMRKYGESKTTRIMMATVPHVISGLGLRKFQADGFFFTRVYQTVPYNIKKPAVLYQCECMSVACYKCPCVLRQLCTPRLSATVGQL